MSQRLDNQSKFDRILENVKTNMPHTRMGKIARKISELRDYLNPVERTPTRWDEEQSSMRVDFTPTGEVMLISGGDSDDKHGYRVREDAQSEMG